MAWRVHVANSAVRSLVILSAQRAVLAVWTRASHLDLFNLEDGLRLGEHTVPASPLVAYDTPQWQSYVQRLIGYDNAYLPLLIQPDRTLFLTDDGRSRLYWDGRASLTLDHMGRLHMLNTDDVERFAAVDFDRELGITAALSNTGQLWLYQQEVALGGVVTGLMPEDERRTSIAIARGGQHIYLSDGRTLIAMHHDGRIRKRLTTSYTMNLMACSPNGDVLALSDNESGVLRLYRGENLQLTHQKFAIDLLMAAPKRQLLEELPPTMSAISSLALHTHGTVVFAMGGVVCVTHADLFNVLPRPRPV